jgi:hypothetical protein
MTQYWHGMQQAEQDGMLIVVDRTYCDMDPADMFDDSCWDVNEMKEKISNGFYDWFDLRVRVLVEGLEVGYASAGGYLYEDAMEVFKDGIRFDGVGFYSESDAKHHGDMFVSTGFMAGELI